MACGPATNSQRMGSWQDLGMCPAPQAELKHNSTDENSCGAPELQSSHKNWDKPVKLNFDWLLQRPPAKKIAQRQLFGSARKVKKDIQNKGATRKALSLLPRPGLPSIRRISDTYKAPIIKQKTMINRSRPSIGKSQYPRDKHDSKMFQLKTRGLLAPGYIKNTRKISESSAEEQAVRPQNKSSSVTALPSRNTKVMRHIPHLANLENSVNLLNVDDVQEKLVKEPSLLKSKLLKQLHKNTDVNSCDIRNDQKILNGQTEINEKLKLVDEKLDKTLYEVTNLKEIIKNLSSYWATECRNCSCHCHRKNAIVTKTSDITETNDLEPKVIQPMSDELFPDTNNYVPDSENETHLPRRSLRLSNKGAQFVYESLRKSTKLLKTPQRGSAKKRNTPGRLTRKVIAQLNELYDD